jgi:hypothetical protein
MKAVKKIIADDRGVVLVISLLILALLLAAGLGAMVSTLTDLKSSGNLKSAAQAFYMAEAGVQHVRQQLQQRQGAMDFDRVMGMGAGAVIVSNIGFNGGTYRVTRLASAVDPSRIKILSAGAAPNNARSEIEVWFRKDAGRPPRSLITNGDLKISGNPKFMGTCGGAHSNDDLQVTGNPAVQMADGITSSTGAQAGGGLPEGMEITGSPCIGSPECFDPPDQQPAAKKLDSSDKRDGYKVSHESVDPYDVPKMNPADYALEVASLGEAGKGSILHVDGTVTTGPGILCGTDGLCLGGTPVAVPNGWSFLDGVWRVTGESAADGVFYSESKVELSGNTGSVKPPWRATIISRDSINISGDIRLSPYPTTSTPLQNHLLVTGNDLLISSNMRADYAAGAILVHQQMKISGNPQIAAFILVGDGQPTWPGDPFADGSPGIALNEISGSPIITYSCDFGCHGPGCPPPRVSVMSWMQKF